MLIDKINIKHVTKSVYKGNSAQKSKYNRCVTNRCVTKMLIDK